MSDENIVFCLDTGRNEAVTDEQLQALVNEGVVHEEEWGWAAFSDLHMVEALNDHPEAMICDFCSSPDVTWLHPCNDFVQIKGDPDRVSRADWAACEICNHLIEQELWEDLVLRSVKAFDHKMPLASPLQSAVLTEAVRTNHLQFKANKVGLGRRVR